MAIERELIRAIRRLDEYDLRRLMIFIRGLLVGAEGSGREVEPLTQGKVTYRQQEVRCGKEACGRCPHGPYWYAYWREDGRLRSRYIGKRLPEGAAPE